MSVSGTSAAAAAYVAACEAAGVHVVPEFADALHYHSRTCLLCDRHVPLTDADIRCMAAGLRETHMLRVLDLYSNQITVTGINVLLAALAERPEQVRELRLGNMGLGDDTAASVARALRRGKLGLRVLDLSRNAIGDAGASDLFGALAAEPGAVVELSLDSNLLSAAVAGPLVGMLAADRLRHLHIGRNAIGDDAAAAIAAALPGLHALSTLDLSENGIGASGGSAIVRALCGPGAGPLGCPSLQRLNLRGNNLDGPVLASFVQVIKANRNLAQLFLGLNGIISVDTTLHMLQAVAANTTLLLLDIVGWPIADGSAWGLASGILEGNHTIRAVVADAFEEVHELIEAANRERVSRGEHAVYFGVNEGVGASAVSAVQSPRRQADHSAGSQTASGSHQATQPSFVGAADRSAVQVGVKESLIDDTLPPEQASPGSAVARQLPQSQSPASVPRGDIISGSSVVPRTFHSGAPSSDAPTTTLVDYITQQQASGCGGADSATLSALLQLVQRTTAECSALRARVADLESERVHCHCQEATRAMQDEQRRHRHELQQLHEQMGQVQRLQLQQQQQQQQAQRQQQHQQVHDMDLQRQRDAHRQQQQQQQQEHQRRYDERERLLSSVTVATAAYRPSVPPVNWEGRSASVSVAPPVSRPIAMTSPSPAPDKPTARMPGATNNLGMVAAAAAGRSQSALVQPGKVLTRSWSPGASTTSDHAVAIVVRAPSPNHPPMSLGGPTTGNRSPRSRSIHLTSVRAGASAATEATHETAGARRSGSSSRGGGVMPPGPAYVAVQSEHPYWRARTPEYQRDRDNALPEPEEPLSQPDEGVRPPAAASMHRSGGEPCATPELQPSARAAPRLTGTVCVVPPRQQPPPRPLASRSASYMTTY